MTGDPTSRDSSIRDDPPVDGEPLLAWEFRERACRVYHVGGYDASKQRAMNELTAEWVDADWRGFVATTLSADPESVDLGVYGGLTHLEDGWAGFHTAHPAPGGPKTLDEMQEAVEALARAVATLED